jgi:hypothetical protein
MSLLEFIDIISSFEVEEEEEEHDINETPDDINREGGCAIM